MQRVALAIVVLLSVSCAHAPPSVTDLESCVGADVAPQVQSIESDVANALASADFWSILTSLGLRVGSAIVDCAVLDVSNRAQTNAIRAPSDDLSKTEAERGAAWLSRTRAAKRKE